MASSPQLSRRLFIASLAFGLVPFASSFSFSYTAPTQCGPLTVSWAGGTAPYYLLITPTYDVPNNISIPSSAYSNGKGTYTTTLQLANPAQFLLTMSDATGFSTGGTSDLLTVADPLNSATCDTTTPTPPFTFDASSLEQCGQFEVSGYTGATQPVTVIGLIPLGSTFNLNPPDGSTSYNWTADIAAGTSVVFSMFDAVGRTGGSSAVMVVKSSSNSSCINSSSPASTITNDPSSTSSAPSVTSTGSSSTGGTGSSSTGGIIGGAVAGGVVFLIILGVIIWFCMRRRRKARDTPHISTHFGKKRVIDPHVDPESHDHEPSSAAHDGSNYMPVPFILPAAGAGARTPQASESGHYAPGGDNSSTTELQEMGGGSSSADAPYNKRREAYNNRPPEENTPARFVLHSDGGTLPDAAPEDEEEETVELPPQYTSINGKVVRSPTYRERGANRRSVDGAGVSGLAAAGGSSSRPSAGP